MSEAQTGKAAKKPMHKATYSRDSSGYGYVIRVQGPHATQFARREVPVTLKSGEVHQETLQKMVWSGTDRETGEPVALYRFEAKPREEAEAEQIDF